MSVRTGETGPRFTCQSLNGPFVTHPPPFPGGIDTPHWAGEGTHVEFLPAMYAPSPPNDVGEPSSAGDFAGSAAQYAHW